MKKCIFSSCKKLCFVGGPFYLLNLWPFWPVFDSKFCLFFQIFSQFSRSCLEIQTLQSLTCSLYWVQIRPQQPSKQMSIWKNEQIIFFSYFANSNLKVIFLTLNLEHQKEIISNLESTQNMCVQLHFHTVMTEK